MKQFIDNFRKYLYLLSQLVKKNIKLRYRRSYLGMLWTLIEPLLTMIVLSVVFGSMKQFRSGICGSSVPNLCSDRTLVVFVLFIGYQQCHEIHTKQWCHDQESVCS